MVAHGTKIRKFEVQSSKFKVERSDIPRAKGDSGFKRGFAALNRAIQNSRFKIQKGFRCAQPGNSRFKRGFAALIPQSEIEKKLVDRELLFPKNYCVTKCIVTYLWRGLLSLSK
ncbi:MAG: hypothetical protein C0424_09140 [Sphingobacteriaceae bacterium]|nr:hypothetical protein [Sphingobacteriaceae bacterium]